MEEVRVLGHDADDVADTEAMVAWRTSTPLRRTDPDVTS